MDSTASTGGILTIRGEGDRSAPAAALALVPPTITGPTSLFRDHIEGTRSTTGTLLLADGEIRRHAITNNGGTLATVGGLIEDALLILENAGTLLVARDTTTLSVAELTGEGFVDIVSGGTLIVDASTIGEDLGEDATLLDFDLSDADQDGNGVPDGQDDADMDGLTNAEEAAEGTNPREGDTDGDGVNDADEVAAGTDPTVPDSPVSNGNGNGNTNGNEDGGSGGDDDSGGCNGTGPGSVPLYLLGLVGLTLVRTRRRPSFHRN